MGIVTLQITQSIDPTIFSKDLQVDHIFIEYCGRQNNGHPKMSASYYQESVNMSPRVAVMHKWLN